MLATVILFVIRYQILMLNIVSIDRTEPIASLRDNYGTLYSVETIERTSQKMRWFHKQEESSFSPRNVGVNSAKPATSNKENGRKFISLLSRMFSFKKVAGLEILHRSTNAHKCAGRDLFPAEDRSVI